MNIYVQNFKLLVQNGLKKRVNRTLVLFIDEDPIELNLKINWQKFILLNITEFFSCLRYAVGEHRNDLYVPLDG